jgi:transposase-like protein
MQAYQILDKKDRRKLAKWLADEGEVLASVLGLVETAEAGVNEAIDVIGRAGIEALLTLSASQVAGPKQPGKRRGSSPVRWHGHESGLVQLAERKLRVDRPRLRRKGKGQGGEVPIPAYEAMQVNGQVAHRVLQILLAGVSTRKYREVLPEMAESVGISKSSVSRELIGGCEETLRELCERRFDTVPLLVIYIDGVRFGDWHVMVAVGVDERGHKLVLGIREGATENAQVVQGLLEDLVDRGVKADRHRLFVIDGSKALRSGIKTVYGSTMPIQRCRSHKERNVRDQLPTERQAQVISAMKAAWKLPAEQGIGKLNDLARWLERDHPSAAASLREGLEEMFTINRLNLSPTLRRCLGTTNIIESSLSGTTAKTGRVTRWRNGAMVVRWAAAALLETEKHYKKIMGYRDLWQLQAHLNELDVERNLVQKRKVG